MTVQAAFIPQLELDDWRAVPRFTLGAPAETAALPVATVGVRIGAEARVRVDVFPDAGQSCFQDVRQAGELIYIGYGQRVAVLSLKTDSLTSYPLDGYFGSIVSAADLDASDLGASVLVASASELLRFDNEGRLLWRRSGLAIDGIVIHRVQYGEIVGEGEWDPPGGWKPMRLRLDTGDTFEH